MTEVIGPPAAPNLSGSPDPDNPMFYFGTDTWLDPPTKVIETDTNDQIGNPRNFFLEHFRLTATPLQWNRYILLGFFSHIDGEKFDMEWTALPINLIQRSKIVWYNFMSFVDRHIDIPCLLEAWATQVAQPYLFVHDPGFLEINTITSSWESVTTNSMDIVDDAEWRTVGTDKHSRKAKKHVTLNEPEHRIRPPASAPKEATRSILSSLTPLRRPGILKKSLPFSTPHAKNPSSPTSDDNPKPAWKQPGTTPALVLKTSQPVTLPPMTAPQTDGNQGTDASVYSETSTLYPDSRASVKQVKTNDGTQRITIRWTPTEQLSHQDNPGEWSSAALAMLHDLLGNDMGAFYPWGNVSLSHWKSPLSLTAALLHEYISPKITYIRSTKTFIFALRFGFSTKTPVKWLTKSETKQAMRKHKVWATVSNSCSTSGNLVHAGYILMKAPNLTHRIKYLKSLLTLMPENTPFFDIIQLKRTPTNQLIHHLAVQCGEYHVEPLSKALSHLLKGNGGALYLPRLLLGNLSPAQMSKYFTVHDNYMKSLRTVTLAPMIENLDSDREEFFENGEVVVRSTRAWALSLTLPSTGLNARCDIVNGGYAQVATLLVPRHNYESILPEVVKYKQRLNPVDQREARFRKTILGLPGVIHIDPSVQEALDTLEMMSSENVWKRAPPAVRQGGTITDNRKPVPSQATASVTSNLSQSSDSESDPEIPPKNRKKKTPRRKNQKAAKNPQEDASMTPSVASIAFSCKDEAYQDLERQLKSVLAQRNQDFKTTQSQLLDIDTKLKQLDPRLDNLEAKAVQSMQYHLDTNNALTAVQSQMSQMMEMMQNITRPTQHQNGLNHERALPSSPLAVITEHPVDCAAIIGVFPKQDTQYEGNRSVASSSSGSQHEKPPPKKTLKRSMPDAVEDPMHLDSCNIEDDASSSSFGSTPPIYPVPEPIPPPPFQLEMEHPTLSPHGSEMETDDTTTLHNLAMPDLEDQYTLSDAQESGDTTSPDGGTNG